MKKFCLAITLILLSTIVSASDANNTGSDDFQGKNNPIPADIIDKIMQGQNKTSTDIHESGGFGQSRDGGCCAGIEQYEKNFDELSDSWNNDGFIADDEWQRLLKFNNERIRLLTNQLINETSPTNRNTAEKLLIYFYGMGYDSLSYLTISPRICKDISGCLGLDKKIVQGLANIAYRNRQNYRNNLPAWGSVGLAAIAVIISLVSIWRTRGGKHTATAVPAERGSAIRP